MIDLHEKPVQRSHVRPVTLPVDLGPPRVKLHPSDQLSMRQSPSACLSHKPQSAVHMRKGCHHPHLRSRGPLLGVSRS